MLDSNELTIKTISGSGRNLKRNALERRVCFDRFEREHDINMVARTTLQNKVKECRWVGVGRRCTNGMDDDDGGGKSGQGSR